MTPATTAAAMAEPNPANTLVLKRTFAAERDRVFAAFTDPAILSRWFGPEGFSIPEAEVDLRVGGRYRITMRSPENTDHTVIGVYRVIDRPDRLSFTWAWETGDMPDADTLVTLDFAETAGGTELTLTHEGFPTEEFRDRHEQGWSSSLTCLDGVVRCQSGGR